MSFLLAVFKKSKRVHAIIPASMSAVQARQRIALVSGHTRDRLVCSTTNILAISQFVTEHNSQLGQHATNTPFIFQ